MCSKYEVNWLKNKNVLLPIIEIILHSAAHQMLLHPYLFLGRVRAAQICPTLALGEMCWNEENA